jgi:hypothetical protein
MTATLISITILMARNWMTFTTKKATRNSGSGLRASNATPSGVLEELFVFYDLRINEGKVSVGSFKMEIDVIGSPQRRTMASALRSKSQSYNL